MRYGRPFEDVFAQTSIYRVKEAGDRLKIYSLRKEGFMVNHMWVQGGILLFPTRVYLWGVSEPKQI